MHDHLVGYWCGALDGDEATRFEQSLDHDPDIRRQLTILKMAFVFLECEREDCCPPQGLAARVCQKCKSQLP